MNSPPNPDHYSYAVYADPATAWTFDERRFGGPIGELVAEDQARVLVAFAEPVDGRRVLDVGTGTGRAAVLLARLGGVVTALDASEAMLTVARQRAAASGVTVQFGIGDAHALTFADRAFDVTVSLRLLMHTPDWRRCLSELCRTSAKVVILDYPSIWSFAALHAAWRRLGARWGSGSEAYRVFSDQAIDNELARAGFRVRARHRHFVLPIALHKAIGRRAVTLGFEQLLGRTGLRLLIGSPVTLVAERCASS